MLLQRKRLLSGMQPTGVLHLGNLDARRDWGHAKDYVEAMWLMLQQNEPEDFVIATGTQYSVRDFVNRVCKELDMPIKWQGKGIDEKGYDEKGRVFVEVSKRYFRPAEVETLLGDATKARKKLGWVPKIKFEELVKEMVQQDLKKAKAEFIHHLNPTHET